MRPVRQEIMWQAVLDALEAATPDGGQLAEAEPVTSEGPVTSTGPTNAGPTTSTALTVVDLGGGTGGEAVQLAQLGHRVLVIDPSPDALASLDRRAADAGLSPTTDPAARSEAVPKSDEAVFGEGTVTGVLADSSDLGEHVPAGSADLVLLHGVLEHVDDPREALASAAAALRPGGTISVVVANRAAAVLAKALMGDFDAALAMIDLSADRWDRRDHGPRRFVPDEITALLRDAGFADPTHHALRVFADLVPGSVVDTEPGGRERLFALEQRVRMSREFSAVSGGLQSVARLDLT